METALAVMQQLRYWATSLIVPGINAAAEFRSDKRILKLSLCRNDSLVTSFLVQVAFLGCQLFPR